MNRNGIYGSSLQPTGLSHRENRAGYNSGRNSPSFGEPDSGYAAHRTAEQLESGNDEALEGLSSKVQLLKQVGWSFVSIR